VVPPSVQVSDANSRRCARMRARAIGFGWRDQNVGHNAIVSIHAAREALRAEGSRAQQPCGSLRQVDLRLLNKRRAGSR